MWPQDSVVTPTSFLGGIVLGFLFLSLRLAGDEVVAVDPAPEIDHLASFRAKRKARPSVDRLGLKAQVADRASASNHDDDVPPPPLLLLLDDDDDSVFGLELEDDSLLGFAGSGALSALAAVLYDSLR